jgi:hypothetical protein
MAVSARQELEETLAKGRERLDDQAAAYREQLDREVERRVEADVRRATENLKADYEDQLRDLKAQRTQARQQRDVAEGQLLALLRQLLGEEGRYLRNACIEAFDQFTINQVLQRHGWRVRSKATYSERTVKTRTQEAHWQARAVFWLDTVPAEGSRMRTRTPPPQRPAPVPWPCPRASDRRERRPALPTALRAREERRSGRVLRPDRRGSLTGADRGGGVRRAAP